MPRIYRHTDDEFELFPDGTTAVVCAGLHFVGRQRRSYEGKETISDQVVLEYVAPGAGSDGRDLAAHDVLTVAFGERANLHNRIKALMGGQPPADGMDLRDLLGRGCMVHVEHRQTSTGRTRAKVTQALPLPRGMRPPAWTGAVVYTDVEDPEHQSDPETVPAIVRYLLEHRVEATPPPALRPQTQARTPPPSDFDDDIPF